MIGFIADRTGGARRRKTWFLIGVPFILLGAWMTLVPPNGAGAAHLAFWGMFLSIGTTCTALAYAAWGAELSPDYRGRNRITAYRETVTVIGTVIVTSLPALLPALGLTTQRDVLMGIAIGIVVLLPITAGIAVWSVPEPRDHSVARLSLRESGQFLAGNRPFLRLVSAFFLNGLANGLPASLFLFFVADRLGRSDMVPVFLLIYFICAVLAVPFWTWLASRVPKHRVWCFAMIIASAAFVFAAFLPSGAVVAFGLICVITGFALGADLMLPPSIQADVIDVDTARTGEQRSGLYFAIWALAQKAALALAVGLAFPLLGWAGYDPAAGLKTETGLLMLALLYAALPTALKLLAIGMIWRFPIDAAEQANLRSVIEARSS